MTRITDTARRYARVLGGGAVTAVAGLKLGSGGSRLRADLDRLRDIHAAVHTQLPDAAAVTPAVGERGGYPAALTVRPAPRWLRKANQHPTGDRAALKTAWDATAAAVPADPSPTPPPSTQVDRSGRIPAPGVPAGRPGGGGAPAGAGSAPRAGHPTWVADAITNSATAGSTTTVAAPAGADAAVPAVLRGELADLDRVFARRGRTYAAARRPLVDALNQLAAEAVADYSRQAARQRLPRRLSVTERQDPRVPRALHVNACAVEDLAYRSPWWLRHVRIGDGRQQQLELWGADWRTVSLAERARLPTLHSGHARLTVTRGRHEPTRLTLALGAAAGTGMAVLAAAFVLAYAAEILVCVAALVVGLRVAAGKRRWWP